MTVGSDGGMGAGTSGDGNEKVGSQEDGAGFGALLALLAIHGAVMAARRRT